MMSVCKRWEKEDWKHTNMFIKKKNNNNNNNNFWASVNVATVCLLYCYYSIDTFIESREREEMKRAFIVAENVCVCV